MKFSTGRVNSFLAADSQERESIRQDVLAERYADLQTELGTIEDLLNITDQERDESLFEISESLFDLLESLIPELTEDELDEGPDDAEDIKQVRVQRIKSREKIAMNIAENAEKLKKAKSNIQTARLQMKGGDNPESKSKAREFLRGARRHLATTGIKAGTTQK